MADLTPPGDGVPTWLTALLSVLSTLGISKGVGPVGRWLGRRLDVAQQTHAAERGDLMAQLKRERDATVEENLQLRREVAEERELRMSFASDVAVLNERIEHLTRAMAEDKRDYQREIRRLNGEVRRLNGEIATLRRYQQQESPP